MRVLSKFFYFVPALALLALPAATFGSAPLPIRAEAAVKMALELTMKPEHSEAFFLRGWPIRALLRDVAAILASGRRFAVDIWPEQSGDIFVEVQVLVYSYCGENYGAGSIEEPYPLVDSSGDISFDLRPVRRSALHCFYRLRRVSGFVHDLRGTEQQLHLAVNADGTAIEQFHYDAEVELGAPLVWLHDGLFTALAEQELGDGESLGADLTPEQNAAHWNRALAILKQIPGLASVMTIRPFQEEFPHLTPAN